ncbi:MAG: PQQ-dependent sugar dehydrogenase [Actinomycetes bacterium]
MTLSRRGHHRIPVAAAAVLTLALVAGCGGAGVSHTSLASSRSARAAAKAAPQATVQRVLARNLNVPWGVAFLPGGDALVSSRDAGTIVRVSRNGGKTTVGRVPGVVSNGRIGGEAGLLGLALAPDFRNSQWLYAYVSTRTDNRVVRMRYRNGRLGALHVVLKGIPRGLHHNGGRIAFGPDRMLYVSTGESGRPALAQQKSSLGGKILRITPTGGVPAGNPFPGSKVWSYGHRNVEGLAWDSAGRLWATEFGDKSWDELNLIRPGHNYGWPATQGRTSNPRYTSPKAQWRTDVAGPAGIAIINNVAWIGALTGRRLYRVPLVGTHVGTIRSFLVGTRGRLRTPAAAPDGSLWLTTSNTDGRATPHSGDDRILRLKVS